MPLYSITEGTSAKAIADLLHLVFDDAETVLDTTWGNGQFWTPATLARYHVVGMDMQASRAVHVQGDFINLPFLDDSIDVTIFDPPYHTEMSKKTPSVMGSRFGSYPNLGYLQRAVQLGTQEAWRVAKVGMIVKVMNYIHASHLVHMTRWVEQSIEWPLYDELQLRRNHKMLDPKWSDQLSVYRNHASFLIFRKGSQQHVRRPRRGGTNGTHVHRPDHGQRGAGARDAVHPERGDEPQLLGRDGPQPSEA